MVLPEPATYKELTISGWANLTSRDTQGSEFISFGNAAIIRLDEISRGTEGICAEIHPSGSIFWRETYPPTSINYANTGWHHFAYTYDEKNHVQRLYVDGNLKNTTYYGGNISFEEVGSIFIGKHAYASGYNFTGMVDDVAIWKRALNDTEINKTKDNIILSDGLIGLWRFDNITDGGITDLSGNENKGFLIGGASLSPGKNNNSLLLHGNDYFVVYSLLVPLKLTGAKKANKQLVSLALEEDNNKFGLVSFSGQTRTAYNLSNNEENLLAQIDNLTANGGTCLCCGIVNATNLFSNPELNKENIMIVMTDGWANLYCNGTIANGGLGPSEEAINVTISAAAAGIKINSIGYGVGANKTFLNNLAIAGNGKYYEANDSEQLIFAYNAILNQNKAKVEGVKTLSSLRVAFYNATSSYIYIINGSDLPGPSESKSYKINISDKIIAPTRVEVYPFIKTIFGKEVFGKTDVYYLNETED